jgi:hypothetical protein
MLLFNVPALHHLHYFCVFSLFREISQSQISFETDLRAIISDISLLLTSTFAFAGKRRKQSWERSATVIRNGKSPSPSGSSLRSRVTIVDGGSSGRDTPVMNQVRRTGTPGGKISVMSKWKARISGADLEAENGLGFPLLSGLGGSVPGLERTAVIFCVTPGPGDDAPGATSGFDLGRGFIECGYKVQNLEMRV